MSTNLSTTNLPTNYLSLDGQVLDMTRKELHEIPTESTLAFHKDRAFDSAPTKTTKLSGLSATQVADVISLLPKNFHEDGQGAVPGRARNLVSSAIEDGWMVTITVRYRDVMVELFQPTATVNTLLRDLITKVAESTARRPENQRFVSQYLTQGLVRYGWDWEAEAMRMDMLQDRRLELSQVYGNGVGETQHRTVAITRFVDNDPSYGDRLTWKEFGERIHAHCPSLVALDLTMAQRSKAAKAQADAAFHGESITPQRAALRLQLAGLQAAAEGRRETLAQAAMPALRDFRPDRNDGPDTMLRRAAKFEADGEVINVINRILASEGDWDGDRRLHIDEVLTTYLAKLTQRLLEITSTDRVVSSADRQQDIYSTSHVIQTLSPLVRVTIGTEVLV